MAFPVLKCGTVLFLIASEDIELFDFVDQELGAYFCQSVRGDGSAIMLTAQEKALSEGESRNSGVTGPNMAFYAFR
jgi:hypothetical protein